MFFLFSETAAAGHAAAATEHAAESGEHHVPAVVQLVNHYIGQPVHDFQMAVTHPFWQKFFGYFGTTPEKVFGEYTVENAVPWYTVMFVLAVLFTLVVVWVLKPRKLSVEEPTYGQLTLEAGILAIRNLLVDNVGPHGLKYFPIIATFGLLILVSNLMGLIPGLMAPTASTSVTFALGISSFVYYNAIGIRENGLLGHLKHFMGPIPLLAILMLPIELVSNMVRPMSLGIRLFGNLFGDEQILGTIGNLATGMYAWINTTKLFLWIYATTGLSIPEGPWLLPVAIMPLSVFVAFMQTFIFVLLSIIYISEVSHQHEEHHGAEGEHLNLEEEGGVITLPMHA
ncbi:MAG: F-type H+-transporting ATPase subunit a [Acidobacteriota bacterium]|jgi:F-type H+-transporting ATPase subunit a|nr:F-type H+-transporting ATPase subunit a [Acidobacteriota bacterium]